MPWKLDLTQVERTEGDRARHPHTVPRASPHLEVLEPRCLLSGLHVPAETYLEAPRWVPAERSAAPGGAGTATVAQTDPSAAAATAPYVIVHEVATPHSSLATAQELPDVPYFGVIGTLGPDDPIDLYQMTLGAGAMGLRFELVAHSPAPALPLQFSLFDAAGRALGRWTSGAGPGDAPIGLELASQALGSTLYLGISAARPDGLAGSSPAPGYQLWVTRLTAPDGLPTSSSPPPSSSPLFLAPFQPSALAPPPTQAQAQASSSGEAQAPLASVSTGPGAGLVPAVGLMPTRTAGPLGGVMDVVGPPAAAVRPLGVTVILAGIDRPSPTPGTDPGPAPGPRAGHGQEDGPPSLVALRGPGGFPLLGAAAIGHWRRAPAPASDADAVAVPDSAESTARDRVDRDPDSLATVAAPAGAEPDAGPATPRPPAWGGSRVPFSFGLSLATALTLNVVLSDPVAGFDYLASRLDANPRDPDRGRRRPSRM